MSALQTFTLPAAVSGTSDDRTLAGGMLEAWRRDGIFQLAVDAGDNAAMHDALAASRRFFGLSHGRKAACASDLSYSGYTASGQRSTAGKFDYPEIFTICKDLAPADPRVRQNWPCHGPVPWPDAGFRDSMSAFMAGLSRLGDRTLQLLALGLGLDAIDAFTGLTRDGWHHMRALRYPAASARNVRGMGAHTDYGMLVIGVQDAVGGMYVRPPLPGEARARNWLQGESSAGCYENEEPWHEVAPAANTVTVYPGDILQFLTGGALMATPHKVRLNTSERFALAYFHEPDFDAVLQPLNAAHGSDYIHYGTHFTTTCMRSDPNRAVTRRIRAERRLAKLSRVQWAKAA